MFGPTSTWRLMQIGLRESCSSRYSLKTLGHTVKFRTDKVRDTYRFSGYRGEKRIIVPAT